MAVPAAIRQRAQQSWPMPAYAAATVTAMAACHGKLGGSTCTQLLKMPSHWSVLSPLSFMNLAASGPRDVNRCCLLSTFVSVATQSPQGKPLVCDGGVVAMKGALPNRCQLNTCLSDKSKSRMAIVRPLASQAICSLPMTSCMRAVSEKRILSRRLGSSLSREMIRELGTLWASPFPPKACRMCLPAADGSRCCYYRT